MKLNTPLVTLLVGAALAVGVLVTSAVWSASTSSASASSAAGATSRTSPAAPAAPAGPATTATSAPSSSSASAPVTSQATAAAPTAAPGATASVNQADVPSQADYVAQVQGGGAAVAVSVHGDQAVAYICNGHAVAAWLRGSAKNGKLDLTGKNGARLMVDYRKADAAGYIMADGTKYTFSAPVVHREPSERRPPGLYEATATVHGVKIKAGWIVLPNGRQVGSVEYFADSAIPPTAEAPVLDLATGTASYAGITLVASLISGTTGSGF